MNLVNLTPHTLTIYDPDGEKIIREIEPSGTVARCTPTQAVVGSADGIPVVSTALSDVDNLPAPQAGTVYIVSSLAAQAVAGERDDVIAPDTGPAAVRDADGRIIGVRRFQRF